MQVWFALLFAILSFVGGGTLVITLFHAVLGPAATVVEAVGFMSGIVLLVLGVNVFVRLPKIYEYYAPKGKQTLVVR